MAAGQGAGPARAERGRGEEKSLRLECGACGGREEQAEGGQGQARQALGCSKLSAFCLTQPTEGAEGAKFRASLAAVRRDRR